MTMTKGEVKVVVGWLGERRRTKGGQVEASVRPGGGKRGSHIPETR